MSELDLSALDSATKYPSIPTYHALDPQTGDLTGPATAFTGTVTLTEKVDGTNARITFLPSGDYLIGSRDTLLYAWGDRVINPQLEIVKTLRPVAERLANGSALTGDGITTLFFEVYGGKIGRGAQQYTSTQALGYQLFDVITVPYATLRFPIDGIVHWREHGGQEFAVESALTRLSAVYDLPLVPRLGTIAAGDLPVDLTGIHQLLVSVAPRTLVALDDAAAGRAEGVVLRTEDRGIIAKAKLQDYERTQRKRTERERWHSTHVAHRTGTDAHRRKDR